MSINSSSFASIKLHWFIRVCELERLLKLKLHLGLNESTVDRIGLMIRIAVPDNETEYLDYIGLNQTVCWLTPPDNVTISDAVLSYFTETKKYKLIVITLTEYYHFPDFYYGFNRIHKWNAVAIYNCPNFNCKICSYLYLVGIYQWYQLC